jgi:hypothetical protein
MKYGPCPAGSHRHHRSARGVVLGVAGDRCDATTRTVLEDVTDSDDDSATTTTTGAAARRAGPHARNLPTTTRPFHETGENECQTDESVLDYT